MAAATATAEVSEPPRPSVVIRPVCGLMPWKPEMTATSLRSLKRLMISVPSMSRMRAEAWASLVRIGICQPCQDRAWMPSPCSMIAKSPAVTCSPEATTASYSRASCIGEASRHHSTNSLVLPAIADTTTATSWPASTSRFTWGETVLYSTNAHWVFYLPAIAVWIAALVLVILSRSTTTEGLVLLCLSASAVVALATLYWTANAWNHPWTTETDVTNLRVVHKTGFIKRRTFEMALDKVESVDVNQSILGRILNYGDVTILGVGEGKETISTIASPLAVRNHPPARYNAP